MKCKTLCGLMLISLLLACSTALAQPTVQQWDRFEVTLKYAYSGNAFTNVTLSATFSGGDTTMEVPGFYDGNTDFKIRFMPQKTGSWKYVTHSNIKQLNNQKGSFYCVPASGENHGPVRVSDTYYFKYADGKPYYPVGTTSYAWNHMGKALQKITLQTLQHAAFNKLRMCVFPKNYDLVKEEPEIYPFPVKEIIRDETGNPKKRWDLTRFDDAFFRTLEAQIDELNTLGIEADLILFHPYDKGRWGFDSLPMDVNLKYIQYITARLSSFRNVWWSLANEWDYVTAKTHDDWMTLAKAVKASDPYHHLESIHGSTAKYIEYWLPEFTHASIQDEAPVRNWGAASILRNAYRKPIIYDEVGYEGNLNQRWGRYSGEEMTELMWMGAIGGTYVTHGESFMFHNETDTIFWAKGGTFQGSSWQRAGFLRKILEDGPGPLQPADISRDLQTATAGKGYYLMYFGREIRDSWLFNLPLKNAGFERLKPGTRFKVDIIDTWDMTVKTAPLTFETGKENDYRSYDKDGKKLRLPLKPYIALRITEVP